MGGSGSSSSWSPTSGGGTSGSKGGGGGSSGADKCDLRFKTDLFAPVAGVADKLKVGEKLSVVLYPPANPNTIAALTMSDGKVAGTITGASEVGTLAGCLQQGHAYEAEVTAVASSKITVVVSRV